MPSSSRQKDWQERLKGWQTDQHQAFHLCSVWKGLSLPYWPVQPHSTLYQSRNSIVSWDWQMPNICIQSWPISFVDTSLYSHIVDNLKIANNLSVKTSCCMSPPPCTSLTMLKSVNCARCTWHAWLFTLLLHVMFFQLFLSLVSFLEQIGRLEDLLASKTTALQQLVSWNSHCETFFTDSAV